MSLRSTLFLSLLVATPAAVSIGAFAAPPATAPAVALEDDVDVKALSVDQLIERLQDLRDEAGYDTVRYLGKAREPKAAEALVESYKILGSLGMRLEVLKALARFGGVSGAEQLAMQHLLDVATTEMELEVRDEALKSLANAAGLGREYLAMVVEYPVDDAVRKRAMQLHVEQKQKSDEELYRRLFENEPKTASGKAKKGDDKPVRPLPEVREAAFAAMAEWMEVREVEPKLEDWSHNVRRTALVELHRRQEKSAKDAAEKMFSKRDEWPENRLAAARVLLETDLDTWIDEVVDEGGRRDATIDEVKGMGDLVAEFGDEKDFKGLVKRLGKGSVAEKLFTVRALVKYTDKKVEKGLVKLLEDKSTTVRLAVIENMGDRGDPAFLEDLDEILEDQLKAAGKEDEKKYTEAELARLVDSISRLRKGDDEWNARLREFAASNHQGMRNAAVQTLGKRSPEASMDVLTAALNHEDWSTRLLALAALEELRTPEVVGMLIDRVQQETGRMGDAFGDALWRLTGMPYAKNGKAWTQWWADNEADFEPISARDLRALEEERERRRLEESSKAPDFFGLRIQSTRVTFVVDVSGSMEEPTLTRYAGEKGPQRMDVAKDQLGKAVERLDPAALFNIVTFSGDIDLWKEGLTRGSVEAKEEAAEFIGELRAGGGTNLYGSLRAAFADPEMDTLVVLSDGEPSVGDVLDIGMIREHVQRWNRDRGVVIHTVQVGAKFKILEWLAEDSGGETVAIP